jgi:hypothetical protein
MCSPQVVVLAIPEFCEVGEAGASRRLIFVFVEATDLESALCLRQFARILKQSKVS